MKNYLTIVLISLLSFFLFSLRSNSSYFDYQKLRNQIKAEIAKKMAKKYAMDWIGEGGQSIGCVCMISICFEIKRPLSKDEARYILLDCAEELLKTINQNKQIRPYLRDYPFTSKNIEVAIHIKQQDGQELYDPYISVISVHQSNKIIFRTTDPQNLYRYKNEYSENYKDALEIVKKGQCDMSSFIRN